MQPRSKKRNRHDNREEGRKRRRTYDSMIVVRDLNASTEEGGSVRVESEGGSKTRRSVDKIANKERKVLLEKISERSLMILNGSIQEIVGWTFI